MYKNEYGECSIYSVTVYLNDNFDGGRVLFMKNKDARDEKDMLYTFKPKKGTALVFNHDTLHAGEEVVGGTKYIFRTGIMFRHVENLADPNKGWEKDPLWIRNREVFKTFTSLGKEGNPEKFTKTFLELQQIQLEHGRSLSHVEKVLLGLSEELLFNTFSFLPLKDLLQLAQICKSWLTIARNGILWRKMYAKMWSEEAAKYIQDSISGDLKIDPAVQQWYAIYKKRSLVEATQAPLIIYISYDVVGCLSQGENTKYIKPFLARAYLDNDPWDNSYSTYEIGSGDCWSAMDKKNRMYYNGQIYNELVKTAMYRVDTKNGQYKSSPHPFVIICESNAWCEGFEILALRLVKRTLNNEAFAVVEAPLCSLYAKKLSTGITVGLEMGDMICVRAWSNFAEHKGIASKLFVSRLVKDPLNETSAAKSVFDMICDIYEKAKVLGQMPQTVVISKKKTKRGVGTFYRSVIPLLVNLLEAQKWKVLFCSEKGILHGAQIIAGLPKFQEKIKWKSTLFDAASSAKSGKEEKEYVPYTYGEDTAKFPDDNDDAADDADTLLYDYNFLRFGENGVEDYEDDSYDEDADDHHPRDTDPDQEGENRESEAIPEPKWEKVGGGGWWDDGSEGAAKDSTKELAGGSSEERSGPEWENKVGGVSAWGTAHDWLD
eukprot:Phypoly_transcript_02867.p1 GENE.Phypoly_transcript_02867~~Phypoly_transcript_02867.p1  ORF type:complete len:659 (+),score=110.42 Phypoly_transcript_02867:444-2420(+)